MVPEGAFAVKKTLGFFCRNLPGCHLLADEEGVVLAVSDETCVLLGYSREEIEGAILDSFICPAPWWDESDRVVKTGEFSQRWLSMRHSGGQPLSVLCECREMVLGENRVRFVWLREADDFRGVEEGLKKESLFYRQLFLCSPLAVVILNEQGLIREVNPAFENLFGLALPDVAGRDIDDLIVPPSRRDEGRNLTAGVMCGKERVVTETERQKGDGQLLPVRIFAYPLQEAGSFHGAYVIYEDIAGRIRKEAKILNMAKRDPLTGIFNRRAFLESAGGKTRASLAKEQSLAFFFLDLNEFKEVNDNYGHYFGDRLLVQIARGLQGLIRGGDVLGRIGGDEFALIVSNCNRNVARNISERLVGFFRQTFHVQGIDLSVGVSIGVAICPGDGSDVPSLMRFADEAMYRAKRDGCGFCFYA